MQWYDSMSVDPVTTGHRICCDQLGSTPIDYIVSMIHHGRAEVSRPEEKGSPFVVPPAIIDGLAGEM